MDEITPYNTEQDLMDILQSFVIDVRIIGSDYKDNNFTWKDYCDEKGIEIFYTKRDHRFSSSALKKEVFEQEQKKIDSKLGKQVVWK